MSNAAEITARAAATVTNHDEWVAFMSDAANVTDFARTQIRAELIGSVDYYDRLLLAQEVQYYLRLEVMTDEELKARQREAEEQHYRAIQWDDPSEYDVDDHESYHAEQYAITELLLWRSAQARYTGAPAHLTHSPFAGLVA